MTYFVFHLVFLLPPILVLGWTLPRPLAGLGDLRARVAIPLLCAVAFTYTAPWDNYLVARAVWWYGPDRVLATIGHVPVEEYAFFILQPILTGLFLYHVLGWQRRPSPAADPNTTTGWAAPLAGAAVFAGLSAWGFGVLLTGWTPGTYLALILAWAGPVLCGMWLYDGNTLWTHRGVVALAVGLPTLYLWIADAIAIRNGIWTISDRYTIGLAPFGLPVEEATFFLMTNLLVVKGILLLLWGDHQAVSVPEPASATSSAP
jgi:lycopene cyclase domain-containing protein